MRCELTYGGRKLKLRLSEEKLTAKELRTLLEAISRLEEHVSEEALRTKVVRQLKREMLQDGEYPDDLYAPGWWDVPQDLVRGKESGPFLSMEADLSPAVWYDKTSFSLKTVITENGKELVLDRDACKHALQRLGTQERLKKTTALLVRVKGALTPDLRSEMDDVLRKHLPVERLKIVFEKRSYGERASLELVFFGDFPVE